MSSANIGWLFYKDYFKGIDYSDLKSDRNTQTIEKKVTNIIEQKPALEEVEPVGSTRFQATTSYPGLILGSGNAHELSGLKGQATLGFSFDYTSGLPIIAGSSIKGVLRSAFAYPEYIQELIEDETVNITELESEIFENVDIFYDANIIKADSNGRILGDDYLTPHDNPLKDPIPIRFIKVMPEVTFLFEFELSEGILSKDAKVKLFRDILEDLGLGAKTNVGYGKLSTAKAPMSPEEEAQAKAEREAYLKKLEEKRLADLEAERLAKIQAKAEKEARLEKEKEDVLKAENEKREALVSEGLSVVIENATKYKALEAIVKKYIEVKALDDDEKILLETHMKTKVKDKIKRKKFPFGTFGNEKCLGKERANALADALGLK